MQWLTKAPEMAGPKVLVLSCDEDVPKLKVPVVRCPRFARLHAVARVSTDFFGARRAAQCTLWSCCWSACCGIS